MKRETWAEACMKKEREMSNEVAKAGVFGGKVSLSNVAALKDALVQSAQNDPRGGAADGASYMNFSGKRGVYEIGTQKRGCADEAFLINVVGFEDGWICWKDGSPKAKRMYPLGTTVVAPDMEEFGPFPKDGDGWYQAKSLVAKSLDNDEQVYFTSNSISGVSTFAALQKEITERMRTGQPYWPVVIFGAEPFTSKGYKNYKPVITIDGWLNDEQVMETLPALMESDADFSLEDMYAEAAGAPSELTGTPTGRGKAKEEPKPETVTRRRRNL